jgi:hypothetical protein
VGSVGEFGEDRDDHQAGSCMQIGTASVVAVLSGVHSSHIVQLAWRPSVYGHESTETNGQRLASVDHGGKVVVWDVSTASPLTICSVIQGNLFHIFVNLSIVKCIRGPLSYRFRRASQDLKGPLRTSYGYLTCLLSILLRDVNVLENLPVFLDIVSPTANSLIAASL